MKIIVRAVLDWDGNILEEESYEYCGQVALCKSSGSAPQPTDPYAQAAAQYGLDTGAANYNAALNRTNTSNPLGSSSWSVTGTDGNPNSVTVPLNGSTTPGAGGGPMMGIGGSPSGNLGGGLYGFGAPTTGTIGSGANGPGASGSGLNGGSGAPIYSQQTSLSPWANQMLASPINTSNIPGAGGQLNTNSIAGLGNIDTSNVPGMPGGPNLTQSLQNTQQATYNQQMGYLQPQEALQTEQQNSQLANEGITPGSAAYGQAQDQLGRQQTFANQQAADSSILAGNQEQAQLYGLGTQGLQNQLNLGNASLSNQLNYGNSSLQNQLAERNAPISEYEQMLGNGSGGQINAQTPDISGAFNQQYQGALAGYNANTATNNANTSAAGSLAASYLMYLALA